MPISSIEALAKAGGVNEETLNAAHGSTGWRSLEAAIRSSLKLDFTAPTPPHKPFIQFMNEAGLIEPVSILFDFIIKLNYYFLKQQNSLF